MLGFGYRLARVSPVCSTEMQDGRSLIKIALPLFKMKAHSSEHLLVCESRIWKRVFIMESRRVISASCNSSKPYVHTEGNQAQAFLPKVPLWLHQNVLAIYPRKILQCTFVNSGLPRAFRASHSHRLKQAAANRITRFSQKQRLWRSSWQCALCMSLRISMHQTGQEHGAFEECHAWGLLPKQGLVQRPIEARDFLPVPPLTSSLRLWGRVLFVCVHACRVMPARLSWSWRLQLTNPQIIYSVFFRDLSLSLQQVLWKRPRQNTAVASLVGKLECSC